MRRWLPRLALLAGAVALAWWLWPWRSERIPVRVVHAERAAVESTVTNSKAGTVRARRRARLSAEIGGRVVEISKREGDWAERGEPLVRLNDASLRAQLRLAREDLRAGEASRHEACIGRDRALRELERTRSLAAEGIVSDDLLDELESGHRAAGAACSAAKSRRDRATAAIALAEADLDKAVIRAPFDGVIAEQSVEVGEWVTPSPPLLTSPSVVDIIDPSSLYVSAPMDEVDSSAIRAGQRAKVTVDSHPEHSFAGRVVRVAPYVLDVETQNRTVEVEVELEDRELAASLLPGTSADVEVVLEVRNDVLRIPTAALLEGRRVLVADDGVLEERQVEVGLRNWDWAEVRSGIDEGQRVVISLDRAEVEAGARVEVEETSFEP